MADRPTHFGSKADLVAETLKREIQEGILPPGFLLKQRDLAERFFVSPTPVREALSRLQAEGFIVTELHRGASVVRPALDRLWENALIRAELEVLACQLASAHMSPDDVNELTALNSRFAAAGTDSSEAARANREFHFRIYEVADAPVLLGIMTELWRALDRAPHTFRDRSESIEQHAALIAALGRKDAQEAGSIARLHVSGASHRMRRELGPPAETAEEGA